MNVNQQSSLTMPAPRAPVNQKIDTDNAMVQNHNAIYQQLLAQIREDNTYTHAVITLNPYGTAPLSLYLGVWVETSEAIDICVFDSEQTTVPILYRYDVHLGANLIPVSGLVAGVNNKITLTTASGDVNSYVVLTDPLPASDSADVTLGFPIIRVTQAATDPELLGDGLYFSTYFDRYNLAFDRNGIVRWYVGQDIPSYNFVRMNNSHFLATSRPKTTAKICMNLTLWDVSIPSGCWITNAITLFCRSKIILSFVHLNTVTVVLMNIRQVKMVFR